MSWLTRRPGQGCVADACATGCTRRYRIINALVAVDFEAERVAEIMRRFLTLARCMSIQKFLSGWFHGAPYEAIRRGNVKDFVAYGFYCRTTEELPPAVRRPACTQCLA